ncbi:glucose-1-phosphate thymidylyltransferase [Ferroacidibacillus organovorans]|uniref:Glucose-1-phosphate thymidylyltransferase n=1 Tax=Ferroacidibacillus organovorans TaxID=1765683 RepID=A0A101XNW8_9BACL|nr:glucose-1-phosphate thymidylyltransferase [Ferroacidibacillus organovorans]KUO94905.1 glucose-1-phosphate thymidylyltransferase [Ferroacidibacillus organovorans]
MKALILSGGTGSRLRPLTYTGAKQLIPVANKPILFYAIEAIREAGITEIGMIVGDTGAEIERVVGDGQAFGVKITYIPQEAPLGLAHAVKIAESFIGADDFLMFLGDNLVRDGVRAFSEQFQTSKPNGMILLSRVPNPQRFGVAEIQGGQVTRLIEKPKVPPSDLALVGVYLFDRSIFRAVNEIAPSARGELEITDAIQHLIDHGYRVEAHIIDGWWKDTGKPEDMLEANRMMVENIMPSCDGTVDQHSQVIGRACIASGAVIENSVIRGPVVIGANAVIRNSYIGPFTSISEGVRIEGSELENSIILQDTVIEHIPTRIDSSLIGKNVHISKVIERPKALTFVLGDNSRAEVQ